MTEPDEAMDRLRTSDPATGSHPDLHSLRDLVAQKAPASGGSDEVTRIHDDPLRSSRSPRVPWIAAAAVAALGLGAGGYTLGLQQAEPAPAPVANQSTTAGPASPGLDLASEGLTRTESFPMDGDMGMGGDVGMGGEAMDMATEGEGGYDSSGMAWDMGPVRLTAGENLPASPGTGEVLAVVSDQDPDAFAQQMADHLGMQAGPLPMNEDYGYQEQGLMDPTSGQVIHASINDGPLNFYYESLFENEWCLQMFEGMTEEDMVMVREDWANSYGPDMPFPDATSCRTPTGPAPSQEEAIATAQEFFAAVGVDLTGLTPEAYDNGEGSSVVNVDFWPEGSVTTPMYGSAMVGPEGVVSAYGNIGELTSLGQYPVISAAEAVERYGTREWGMEYSVSIPEDYDYEVYDEAIEMPEYELPEPTPLQPGEPIQLLRKDKVVTDAELVQGSLYTYGGSGSLEVPVWKLITDDGMYYSVLALSEEALVFQSWE